MAFTDIEYQAVKKEVAAFVKSIRPPVHVRNELDIVYSINDQTIDIGEQRPVWRNKNGAMQTFPSARIRYVRSLNRWNVYRMRRDMKWHLYSAERSLADALEAVRTDPDGCFFG